MNKQGLDVLMKKVADGDNEAFARLYDGDIGLFETDGGIVFRQFCADSRGTVYLFAVNRAHAEDDRMIPPDKAAELVCYGRLELKKPIPLPMD